MGNALRYGLMGAASGFLTGMAQVIQEARTERLRKARLLEEQSLQQKEKADDRKYQEGLLQKQWNRDDSRRGEERSQKVADIADARKYESERDALKREQSVADLSLSQSEKAKDRQSQLDIAKMRGLNMPGRTPEAVVVTRRSGGKPETAVMTPEELNRRKEEGWVFQSRIRSAVADAPTSAPPTNASMGAGGPAAAVQKSGGSRDNPVDATTLPGRPPSGTWIRLPSGAVVQVP